jgi:cyclophilin family peptidyl-prolyl cis-trans isomerase
MSKRSRDRQLAKLAARRQAERYAATRRRNLVVGALVGVLALLVAGVGVGAFVGSSPEDPPGSATASPSASPSASPEPGTKVGTVTPTAATETGEVACGAEEPPGADEPKPQFAGPPPMRIERKGSYTATLVTSCGTIVIELDAKAAPQTVNSFVFLARKGYFDGQYFHRLDTSIDVIQGGDPTGTGSGGPGYTIPDELGKDPTYPPGTVAMAKGAEPNSGGSQFFVIAGPDGHHLDDNPQYTVFGTVVSGMDVAERILDLPIVDPDAAAAGDLQGQRPARAVYLERVTIRERRA